MTYATSLENDALVLYVRGELDAVTVEGDAHPNFKRVLADARPEDIVTFMSVAGLPARAVLTPWLRNYLRREKALQSPDSGHDQKNSDNCVDEKDLRQHDRRDELNPHGKRANQDQNLEWAIELVDGRSRLCFRAKKV